MNKKGFLSIYLMACLVLMAISFVGINNVIQEVSAAPDDGIDGFQELFDDWAVTGYEEYSHEIIALHGDLTIQSGGHLVLKNCTLMMMSIVLQPHSIIVENGGILEMYECYVTDTPDDDDTEFLSAYYYFIARGGSTLIIENSTVRQSGFIDTTNQERNGLFVGTNQGHISNSIINTSIAALSFSGNNTGFRIDNINVSQISMNPILLTNSEGLIINKASFQEIGEDSVVNAGGSFGFSIENLSLNGEEVIYIQGSSGFTIKNIIGNNAERPLRIYDSSYFDVRNVSLFPSESWNRRIDVTGCSNFNIDNISVLDDNDIMYIEECSHATISNLLGSNLTRFIELSNSENIEISEVNVDEGYDIFRFWESNEIIIDNINLYNVSSPIYLNSTDNSIISNLSILGLEGIGIVATFGSDNITVSNTHLETDSMEHTRGFLIDHSSTNIKGYSTYNINLSISSWFGDMFGEDILVNGTYEPYSGIEINNAEEVYLSNITILNPKYYGIKVEDCKDGDFTMNNVYINDSNTGFNFERSNANLSNLAFDNVVQEISTWENSYITVMNSTINNYRMVDSHITCIDAPNASSSLMFGSSSLTWKWWVDVYVEDIKGPVAGARVDIRDNTFSVEIQSVTGPDGFARNIPVIETVWTTGPTADSKNPHTTRAYETGWSVTNSTPYFVKSNMQVNVKYNGNAPPNAPTNLLAQSDVNSDTILTWDPSTSWDVVGYNIYMAKDSTSLSAYISSGISNATVKECYYTHVSGSANWEIYYYAVKANDSEYESARYAKTNCGDWVVNKTTPQYVDDENITLYGSLLVFGHLEVNNSSLRMATWADVNFAITINNSASFKGENITVMRKDDDDQYYFNIGPDAYVNINGSYISRPGIDQPNGEQHMKGIHSLTRNLTITNSTIEVRHCGLGIFGVTDFRGYIYNVTFNSYSWEQAEYLLNISGSSGVDIENCNFSAKAKYGMYIQFSSHLNISHSYIFIETWTEDDHWGIYMDECSHSRIFDNTLIYGRPAIYLFNSVNMTIESSNISGSRETGIYVDSSWYTTIRDCYFPPEGERPDVGIYTSWCRHTAIEDMVGQEIEYFIVLENESASTIKNIEVTMGDIGIRLINSNNIFLNDTYIHFIQTGMMVTGCHDIYLTNLNINLTINCLVINSPGPVILINCSISNGIGGDIIAEGYGGELGMVFLMNSTISPISDESLILNNSAVVSLINTSFNLTKLRIDDSGSRVEVFHYISIQVYDIDNFTPSWANITIFNTLHNVVYEKQVVSGYAEWILIHQKTIFRDDEYSDNPHHIYFDDGSHFGELEVYINETGHVDLHVSNVPPWLLWVDIFGYLDMPDPIPDKITYNPKTEYDIVLNYSYVDPENDPESGTIVHWYINGVFNSTFNNMTTINHQYTRKGQLWQAMVYPSDGYDSTYPAVPFESNVLHIENTPPELSNVTIFPSSPNSGDDLFVDYDIFDMDGDGLDSSKTSHRWYRYNEISGDWDYFGIDSYHLSNQYTSKGQLWRCEVTPNDGDDYGSTNISQVVLIGNTPPSIQNPKIISETGDLIITGMDNLKVVYNYTDVDDDNENGTTYEWYLQRDGSGWTKYDVNSSILPNTYTQRGDLWRCKIVPMDGEDTGDEAWTDGFEVFNTPPMVFNVAIFPQYATSSDTLKVVYEFYDYDGDEDNGTSFRWVYQDALGVGKESGISGNITPSSETKKGETWYCDVTPSDGMNVGGKVRSSGVVIHNTPPYISDANIVIVTNEESRYLILSYSPEDIDGDDLDVVEIQWFVNGAAMPQFDNDQTIPGDYLTKGEKWNATLRVFDGEDWSGWYTTDYVSIPNTPPIINGTVTLTPQKALSNEDLIPVYEDFYLDEDGDSLSLVKIKWYKDNGHMEDYDDLEEISWELTKKGEIWYYKIRVSDGEGWSDWYSSSTSVIENTPPSNISLSIEESEVTLTETETKEFQASANDMDGDTLSYRWTLDGRIVLLEEGVSKSIYLMKTDYESEGEYILRLVISDGDDTYENTWTINIQKMNRLPVITVVEPEGKSAKIKEKDTLNFAIAKSDPDGDNLDVRWLLDGTVVWEGSDKYTYSPDYYSSGDHNITAEVYEKDTGANSTYTWGIEVEDVEAMAEAFFGKSYDWWGLVLAILSGIAAILISIFGLIRVRRKKGKLKEYMVEMDKVIEGEEDVDAVEEKLEGIENQIKEEFSEGKIEDLHFLMLQEIIASKRGDIRKAEVTRKFERLPEGVLKELDEMLKDGKISKEEYEGFAATLSKTKSLSAYEKKELSRMIGEWEVEDKDSTPDKSPSEKVKPKKSEIDEELEQALDFLDEEKPDE